MSSHHDHHNDHHVSETKPVAFTVPLIFGLVTVLIILLFVSIGDPCQCQGECQADATEMTTGEGHEKHETAVEAPASKEQAVETEEGAVAEPTVAPEAATPKAEEAKEVKKEEAH